MGMKDIDLNKDGVTVGDHIEKIKDKAGNMLDGDDANAKKIVDKVSNQILGSNLQDKIEDIGDMLKK